MIFELREQPLVRQIQRVRILPVVMRCFRQACDDIGIAHFDGQFPPAIEASRSQVDRADDRRDSVRQKHLRVQPQVLEAVDLDSHVVEDAQSADAFDQLLFLERVRRPRHHVDLHSAPARSNQVLDDDGVLIPLVLQEERVLGAVDESADRVPPTGTPDEMTLRSGSEPLPFPVRLEAIDDLANLLHVGRDDRVVAGAGEILRRPVEGLHERGLFVHHHRLLVRQVEVRIRVRDLDAALAERPPRAGVLFFSAAASGVQHHLHFHPPALRRDQRAHQRLVGKDEHLHANRSLRRPDGVEDGLGGIVGKHDGRSGCHLRSCPAHDGTPAGAAGETCLDAVELRVLATEREQRLVGALLGDRAVLQDDDVVGVANGAQAVSDGDHRPAVHGPLERLDDHVLGLGVERGGRLVEDENG